MEVNLSEEIEGMIFKLKSKINNALPEAVQGGAEIIEVAFKNELAKHKRSGELLENIKIIGPTKSKTYSGSYYAVVTATGTVKGKTYRATKTTGKARENSLKNKNFKIVAYRNFQKLLALEYGTSKQNPTPVMRPAEEKSKSAVETKVIEILQKELNK